MDSLLEATSLTKTYRSAGETVYAVRQANLTLPPQDYVSIVGPSGAGKSTLLHLIGGLDTPTSGGVAFEGRDIYRMSARRRALFRARRVGFVFQFYHLIEELNVIENVALAAAAGARKSALKKARELLKYLGLEDRVNFFPSQLSGGQKQKVAIARALINDPQLVLCDEPTGNLDKDSQAKVVELLEKLNQERKKTIVVVTHNLELAQRAKRVMFIEAGHLKENS